MVGASCTAVQPAQVKIQLGVGAAHGGDTKLTPVACMSVWFRPVTGMGGLKRRAYFFLHIGLKRNRLVSPWHGLSTKSFSRDESLWVRRAANVETT